MCHLRGSVPDEHAQAIGMCREVLVGTLRLYGCDRSALRTRTTLFFFFVGSVDSVRQTVEETARDVTKIT